MRAVLGIDAAWTLTEPSGVALAREAADGWRLVAAASSYQRFHALADGEMTAEARPTGARPDIPALLASASALLGGRAVDLVAVDMPLALSPVAARRACDNAVSAAYGGPRKCGTHSPSALRPGRVSDAMRHAFTQAGYALCTEAIGTPGLIEVYPHPALLELAQAAERLPYKLARAHKYWPGQPVAERHARLVRQWQEIVDLLEAHVIGVAAGLPIPAAGAPRREMKACEDALDAVVCAWVAICALEGGAAPFGDRDSAIWVPRPAAA